VEVKSKEIEARTADLKLRVKDAAQETRDMFAALGQEFKDFAYIGLLEVNDVSAWRTEENKQHFDRLLTFALEEKQVQTNGLLWGPNYILQQVARMNGLKLRLEECDMQIKLTHQREESLNMPLSSFPIAAKVKSEAAPVIRFW
jgi:hypothetical protein